MVRNLFILSLLSLITAGCMGPEKGPSPVTDGAGDGGLVPVAGDGGLVPVDNTPFPAPAPAPTKGPTKSKGKLPLGGGNSNK